MNLMTSYLRNSTSEGKRIFLRRAQFVLLLTAALCFVGVGLVQAKKKKPLPPPADLPGHINYLARQLYGLHLDESDQLTAQIEKLVLDDLEKWMANRTPSDVEVRRHLEADFALFHYPIFGQPAVFSRPWKGGVMIGAGYTLGWSDYDRVNIISLFESLESKSRLLATAHFVPRTDLHYEFFPTLAGSNEFTFLAWGTRLGKSQPRLSAMLFGWDGQSLKSLWEIRDAYDGKLDVDDDKVVIRYLKEDEYIRETQQRHKPPRHEATYLLTPTGLQLQADRDIPF
jgi:hypothetical protein